MAKTTASNPGTRHQKANQEGHSATVLSANLKNSPLNLVRKNSSPGKKRCSSCSWQPSMSRVRTRQSAVVVWCVRHRISTGFEPLNADPSYLWARPRIGLRWQDQQAFTFQLVIGNIRCISSWRNFFDDFFHHGIFSFFTSSESFIIKLDCYTNVKISYWKIAAVGGATYPVGMRCTPRGLSHQAWSRDSGSSTTWIRGWGDQAWMWGWRHAANGAFVSSAESRTEK